MDNIMPVNCSANIDYRQHHTDLMCRESCPRDPGELGTTDAYVILSPCLKPDGELALTTTASYSDVDSQSFELLDIIINCALLNTTCLLGIVGNVLNIMVLRLHNLRESTTMVLLSLSIVDLIYVITMPIRRSHCFISRFDEAKALTFMAYSKMYLQPINRLANSVSSAHIVLISMERTIAVYLPFQVSSFFSTRNTLIYLTILYGFWIVSKIPYFDGYKIVWLLDDRFNKTVATPVNSKFLENNYEVFSVINNIASLIRGPVNVCIVLVCSCLIAVKLYTVNKRRAEMSGGGKKVGFDIRVVKMLLVVSVVYLSVSIPAYVPYILFHYVLSPRAFLTARGSPKYLFQVTDFLIDYLYALNSSVNFLIYVTMSSKFSVSFRKITKPRWSSKSGSNRTNHQSTRDRKAYSQKNV